MRLFFMGFLALISITIQAQTQVWTLPFDSDGEDEASAIAYAKGKVYVAGEYTGKIDVDPSSFKVELSVGTAKNAFVAVYSDAGELLSGFCMANGDGYKGSKHFDEGEVSIKDIEVDEQGNIYVAGYFINTVDFNPQGETKALTSPEGSGYSPAYDGFVAKYSQDGVLLWVRHLSGEEGDDISNVELDSNGNVYYQGTYSGNVDFDAAGEGDVHTGAESNYGNNTFISKVSSDNKYCYTITMHSYNGADAGRIFTNDFKVDKANNVMYLGGHFAYKAYLDNASEEYSLANDRSGKYSGFIAKYTLDGQFIWASEAVRGEASTIAKIVAIAINSEGDIFTVGDFSEGSITFKGGAMISSDVVSYAGHFGLFSAANGGNIWGWGITQGTDYAKMFPQHAIVSPDNEYYVYGRYMESLTFDLNNISTTTTVTESSDGGVRKYDNFLFKITSTAATAYRTFGGSGHDAPEGGLALGDNKEIYAAGAFAGTASTSIQDAGATMVDFNADGGFLTRFDNAQQRSNAKAIVSTSVGTIDELNKSIAVKTGTTIAQLAAALQLSPLATFKVMDGTQELDKNSSALIMPSFTIVVMAENTSTQVYLISVLSSELFSTSIGELNNAEKTVKKIPDGTDVATFLGALLYSNGVQVSVFYPQAPDSLFAGDSKIETGMVLQLAYTDTSTYVLSLLRTGNALLATQMGKQMADTIYCEPGLDIGGFVKGIEVSDGASLVFYNDGVEIEYINSEYITSTTTMQIVSEAGDARIIYFRVVDNAENYILASEYGQIVTITSEIINVSSVLTVTEFLDGLSLSEGAEAYVLTGDAQEIASPETTTLEETMLINVLSLSGDIRTYTFRNMLSSDLKEMDKNDLTLYYNSRAAQIHIVGARAFETVLVYDLSGKMVFNSSIEKQETPAVMPCSLPKGIYLVQLKAATVSKSQLMVVK